MLYLTVTVYHSRPYSKIARLLEVVETNVFQKRNETALWKIKFLILRKLFSFIDQRDLTNLIFVRKVSVQTNFVTLTIHF